MAKQMTVKEFANKMDWEGGLEAMVDYGIDYKALMAGGKDSSELAGALEKLEDALHNVRGILSKYEEE